VPDPNPDLTPPSAALLPPPDALRLRLAVALRDVALLRRPVRLSEAAAAGRTRQASASAERQEVAHAG
jgi:hypothetical protein